MTNEEYRAFIGDCILVIAIFVFLILVWAMTSCGVAPTANVPIQYVQSTDGPVACPPFVDKDFECFMYKGQLNSVPVFVRPALPMECPKDRVCI